MTLPTHLLVLPDGRQGAYCDGGDPADYPVIALHGTPGCRFSRWPDESVYARAGHPLHHPRPRLPQDQ